MTKIIIHRVKLRDVLKIKKKIFQKDHDFKLQCVLCDNLSDKDKVFFLLTGITDFISAETLMDIVEKMKHEDSEDQNVRQTPTNLQRHYISEILADKHKPEVFR